MKHAVAAVAFVLSLALPAAARESDRDPFGIDPLDADLAAGIRTAATAPGPGVQLELGGLFAYDTTIRTFDLPLLVRVGLADAFSPPQPFELRFETRLVAIDEAGSTTRAAGFANLGFGAKWRFFTSDDHRLGIAALPELIVPLGPSPFRVEVVSFAFTLPVDVRVSDDVELSLNLGMRVAKLVDFLFAFGAGWRATDQLALRLVFSGVAADVGNRTPENFVTAALHLYLTHPLQLDLAFTKSISDAERFRVFAGVTLRFR